MVKNERGGVGIKTLADGCWASLSGRWDRSSTPTHPERSSLSVECLLASHRMSPAHSAQPRAALGRTLALAGPHLWPQSYPSPKGGQRERKSCKSRQRHHPTRGGEERLDASPWGVCQRLTHTHSHSLTHTRAASCSPWPSSHLLCPHLLSDSQDCGALLKDPTSPSNCFTEESHGPLARLWPTRRWRLALVLQYSQGWSQA